MINFEKIDMEMRLGIIRPSNGFLFKLKGDRGAYSREAVRKYCKDLIILETRPNWICCGEMEYLAYSEHFRILKEREKIPEYIAEFYHYEDKRCKKRKIRMKWEERK